MFLFENDCYGSVIERDRDRERERDRYIGREKKDRQSNYKQSFSTIIEYVLRAI